MPLQNIFLFITKIYGNCKSFLINAAHVKENKGQN